MTNPQDTARRLTAIVTELSDQFLERASAVRTLVVAMLAGQHSLLLGPPGTAKSALARELTARIDGARYWEILLSKFTDPKHPVRDRVHRRDLQMLGRGAERDPRLPKRAFVPPGKRRPAARLPADRGGHREQRTAHRGGDSRDL